jgi:hypothetical protein
MMTERDKIQELQRMAHAAGRAEAEREICAYLRRPENVGRAHTADIAAEIERGEHRPKNGGS